MNLGLLLTGVMLLNSQLISATSSSFSCDFGKGQWKSSDWTMVKNAQWSFFQNEWTQNKDYIENPTPATAIDKWITSKGDESYISMVTKKRFKGNIVVKSVLSFEPAKAPAIILADELGNSTSGVPEYRNYTQIVFSNEGIDVGVYTYDEKKKTTTYVLTAFSRFALTAGPHYEAKISRDDKTLTIKIAGQTLGIYLPDLPDEVRVGLAACQGHDRFYNMSITK
jgi:hypothetical protein